ncbi:CPBP family intramembrane metalloprotease [Stieleria sp. JC731]|uniref:type II CAAX endopeptidase family protein n=1 Tax=Pirellulaceae TaxID=2691357 RepID=UPI001E41C521|nr:type II CAAX endopeptidase family protein [Stieleria sp. JC731]MCC9600835.1 CPBP family intramembrane metalloprotease [Stieleria sp. JC731]
MENPDPHQVPTTPESASSESSAEQLAATDVQIDHRDEVGTGDQGPPQPLVPPGLNPIARQAFDFKTTQPGLYKAIALGWNVLGMPAISLAIFFVASFLAVFLAITIVYGELNPRLIGNPEAMKVVSNSRIGFPVLVVAPQFALVSLAVIFAFFSPDGFRRRLSLVRGHWPLWAWAAAAASTPLIGFVSSAIVGSLIGESENLKMMTDVFRGHGESGFLVPLALMIGGTPALCEELLFRGYIQTRLNSLIGPIFGILIASLLFAVFHLDWVHVIAVMPLGIYLGVIAWRSASIFPAMLAHFINNSISVFAVVLAPEQEGQLPSGQMVLFLMMVLSLSLAGTVVTAIALWRYPTPKVAAAV